MAAFRYLVMRIVNLLEQQRNIDRMEAKETAPARDLFASLNAGPLVTQIERLRDTGGGVGDALEAAKAFGKDLDKSRAVIERRFGYYNRLAVIGTIAQMVIHEIRNRTTVIGRGLRKGADLAERLLDGDSGKALKLASKSVAALESLAKRFASARQSGVPCRNTLVGRRRVHRSLLSNAGEADSSGAGRRRGAGRSPHRRADGSRGDRHGDPKSGE